MVDFPLSERLELKSAERIQLPQDLWASIEEEDDALALTDEQRTELDRRHAEHERDPSSASPGSEVRDRLPNRFCA